MSTRQTQLSLVLCVNLFFLFTYANPPQWPQLDIIMEDFDTQNGVQLGLGVFGIGDINNDGYDDVAVGYMQKTAIYYGGNPMDSQPDLWLSKGIPTAYGDIDGDNQDDFILVNDSFIPFEDSVLIYWGGSAFDTIPDFIIPADTTIVRSEVFGFAIDINGDLNHDGKSDLVITDYGADTHAIGTGKVYIYWGGDSLDSQVDFTITGDSILMGLGWDVSTGDLNNDNWDDLAISGYSQSGPDSVNYMYVDIYMGYSGQNFTQWDYRIRKDFLPSNRSLGAYLTVFDYNADSYDDIITGNEYIFLGSANFDTTADFFINNPLWNNWSNKSANVGDINGDGYDDLGFGLPWYSLNSGYALFYLGGPNMNTGPTPDAGRAPGTNSNFGAFLNAAGDVNNDGIKDIIIGGPTPTSGATGFLICSGDTTLEPITAIEQPIQVVPENFEINAYPNPFNSSVNIQITLSNSAFVRVDIYNILGQLIQTLVKQRYPHGSHKTVWESEESGESGLYFARVTANKISRTIKLLLIK